MKPSNTDSSQWMVLIDEYGVIGEAKKELPEPLRGDLLEAVAELEDRSNHRAHSFPHTELHLLTGFVPTTYIAYVNKKSGWRILLTYGGQNKILLKELRTGEEHKRQGEAIKSNRAKFSSRP